MSLHCWLSDDYEEEKDMNWLDFVLSGATGCIRKQPEEIKRATDGTSLDGQIIQIKAGGKYETEVKQTILSCTLTFSLKKLSNWTWSKWCYSEICHTL